jgi:hypothetical protein
MSCSICRLLVVQYAYGLAWFMVSTWNEFIIRDNNRLCPDERTLLRCTSYTTVLPLHWSVSVANIMNQENVIIDLLFFFLNRPNRCSRCLLFIERHVNLLQYRESIFDIWRKYYSIDFLWYINIGECNDADDLSNGTACPNMIAPDAALYTLHRSEYCYYYYYYCCFNIYGIEMRVKVPHVLENKRE